MAQTKKKKTTAKKKSDSAKITKARAEIKQMQEKRKADQRVIDVIWGVIFIAIGIFLFAAEQFHAAGNLGNTIGDALKGIFGLVGFIVPWYLVALGIMLFINKLTHISKKSFALVFIMLLMLCILNSGRFIDSDILAYDFGKFYDDGVSLKGGGFLGMVLGTFLTKLVGTVGLYIFSIVVIIISLLLVANTPVSRSIEKISDKAEERKLLKEREREEAAEAQTDLFAEHGRDINIITPFDDAGPLGKNPEKKEKKSKKNNVLKYMTDSNLFGRNEKEEQKNQEPPAEKKNAEQSFGLESSSTPSGYGLDGGISYSGYGLDGDAFPKEEPETTGLSENSFVKVRDGKKSYGLDDINDVPKKSALDDVSGIAVMEEPAKLTKKEASSITLDPSEMTAVQKPKGKYKKPSSDLLNKPQVQNKGNINIDLKMKAAKLEETLKNFHVDARVIQVTQGPAVTRYEIQPNVGVKVNSIVRLADDIALNLEAKSIRIEAPIPGKAAVGIEVEYGNFA